MKTKTHKLSYLSMLIGTLLSGTALNAIAEEVETKSAEDEQIEVIEVRGMLSSIKESLFIKQNSMQVVDAIVAEDIGKFPDQNVAEALQRVTGITIARDAGEGQKVVVRGLGGDYNVTTINGRRMASEDSSRDFNYDLIAAELLGGVEVYKSSIAKTQEGGIGAVINIKTRRPMDFDGFTAAASVKAIYEDRTKDTTPQASFLISDTFADGTFGALLTGVYSERTLRIDSYEGEGFWDPNNPEEITVRQDVDGDGTFDKYVDNEWGSVVPGYMRYGNKQDTRERIGASLALQWLPSDAFEVNFDGLYSSYDTNGTESQQSFVTYDESWTEGIPGVQDIGFNDAGLINKLTLVDNGAMAELLNVTKPRNVETFQVGVNTLWHLSDNLSLAFDLSHSNAERSNNGENRYMVARGFVDSITLDVSGSNQLPDVTISPNLNKNSAFGAHYSLNDGQNVEDTVSEFRIDGNWEPENDWVSSVDFGVNIGEQTKQTQRNASRDPGAFSSGGKNILGDRYGGAYAPNMDSIENINDFDLFRLPADAVMDGNFDNFFAGEAGKHPNPWPMFDYDALYSFYQSISPGAAADLIAPSLRPIDSFDVNEQTSAAYVQVNIENEILDLPFALNLGVRAIETKVGSTGFSIDPNAVELTSRTSDADVRTVHWLSDNGADEYNTIVTFEDSYTDVLPSFNFKLNLTEELIFRLAGSQSITRPAIGELAAYSSLALNEEHDSVPIENISTGGVYHASSPGLEPLRANQGDMALEWYFSDYGALTTAFFFKDLKSFVQEDKYLGDTTIDSETFNIVSNVNGEGGFIKGVELAYQQAFVDLLPAPFDGLGVQVNYTYIDSGYDDEEVYGDVSFENMSEHSYNAVIYYEKDEIQARFAYNWRSEFLVDANAWGGELWGAEYGQLDFSASYDVNDIVNVNVSGTNLTNEAGYKYINTPGQLNHLETAGRQFTLGLNLVF